MKFYHSTDVKTDTLVPRIGDRRHGNEDEGAVDKPVVWLSAQWEARMKGEGKFFKYRYVVEVPEDDPDLHEDKKHSETTSKMAQFFGPIDSKWYYCTRPVDVIEAEEWDDSLNQYVPIPLSALKDDG